MASNDTSQCYARGRNSVLQGYPFGGVVVVLALDFIIWLVLLLVFSILRKKAWDYGRLALLNDNDRSVVRGKWRNEIYFPGLYGQVEGNRARLQTQMSIPDYESKDKGFCSWLAAIFRIKDDEIRLKCGMDAVHYLSFQRHILVLLIFVCTLSLAVILPVNFSGTLLENSPINFGRTTIANLNPKDQLLWLHTVFAVLYLLGTVFCMRRHTTKLEYASEEEEITKTVLILGIPKNITDENLLKSHLTEAYNGCEVTQINFCYNLSKLISLDNEV
uniref:CSC1-like protein 2 n=1 Tax=Eptatretus burgeri TaxID=7764 RepID=A0A8C4WWL0_EPTBU